MIGMGEIIRKKIFRDLKKEVARLKQECESLRKENEEIKEASKAAPVTKKEASEKEETPNVLKEDVIISQDSINPNPDVSYAPDIYQDDVPLTGQGFVNADKQIMEFEKRLEEKGML